MSKLSRRFVKFARLPFSDKRFIIVTFLTIICVRFALSFFGYNRLRRIIPPANKLAPADLLKGLGRRVPLLARFVPGASCLTQAVAAQLLLARLGYQSDMRIGVQQDATGQIRAHAWLLSEGKVILGGQPAELQMYAPLVDLSPRSS